ncbi:MAG: PadR family transcriptional regulator [Polyangiaceae bacterium]
MHGHRGWGPWGMPGHMAHGGPHGGPWARAGRGGPGGPEVWATMWNEWFRGPAPRAERGTVRWLVLDAIATQARHGYEIIQSISDKSGGAYKPSPGVIYPTLQMLEELGHARAVVRDERKVYEITGDGQRELADHAEELADFYEGQPNRGWETHAEEIGDLMKAVSRVVRLFKRSAQRGTIRPVTMRKARRILDDTFLKLEELFTPEEL